MPASIVLIGYSGHAFVVADLVSACGLHLAGYCEEEEKGENPYDLPYLDSERSETGLAALRRHQPFVAIGSNAIRRRVTDWLSGEGVQVNLCLRHPSAVVASRHHIGQGSMLAAGAVINPLASVGRGVICNTGCIIEHECTVGDFAHIAPGAVLAGNVTVGDNSFVGANAVVKQGIRIGKNATIGAGAVILRDVPDGATVVGNPGRVL